MEKKKQKLQGMVAVAGGSGHATVHSSAPAMPGPDGCSGESVKSAEKNSAGAPACAEREAS